MTPRFGRAGINIAWQTNTADRPCHARSAAEVLRVRIPASQPGSSATHISLDSFGETHDPPARRATWILFRSVATNVTRLKMQPRRWRGGGCPGPSRCREGREHRERKPRKPRPSAANLDDALYLASEELADLGLLAGLERDRGAGIAGRQREARNAASAPSSKSPGEAGKRSGKTLRRYGPEHSMRSPRSQQGLAAQLPRTIGARAGVDSAFCAFILELSDTVAEERTIHWSGTTSE